MAHYKCNKCKKEKELNKTTICVIDGLVQVKESLCDCGNYMKQVITDDYKGMPSIVRNERNNK